MGFRTRIAIFFVAALVAVQGLTALLVYRVAREELVAEGQRQLQVAADAFARQLEDVSGRVAAGVQVMALDFALRSAIAQQDEATLLSALRNHGRRVGAAQMLLVGVDGRIEADTRATFAPGAPFPYTDLTDRALQRPAAAVVSFGGGAYWMVVVPVFAPSLVGFIAAAIPVDDRLLAQLQGQSSLPREVELASRDATGRWQVLAHGRGAGGLAGQLAAAGGELPAQPRTTLVGGREFVVQAVPLDSSTHSPPVAAVLGYSVDEALRPYRSVTAAWGVLTLLGLLAGLAGAWVIARSVSRPIERLAASARRIAEGDYSLVDDTLVDGKLINGRLVDGRTMRRAGRDELGQLAVGVSTMAGAIREREARIREQASHDQATGLPNRSAAETSIAASLAVRAEGALLMVGLARVQEVIKTLGHEVCDRMMREAGQRLHAPARGGEVARATDTEFSVFLPGAGREGAAAAAFRIVEALGEPYREAVLTLDFAPAVGIALAPAHGAAAGTLLRHGEVALIAAIASGDDVCVYDPATDPHRPERLSLMGELREAIAAETLQLQYQPKLVLAGGRVDACEALVRWPHPARGPIAPDLFVPLAEESGNIRQLTRWVLAAGIAQAARWRAQGAHLRVSLNVSARDLDDVELPRRVAELLAIHGVPPESIVLEITESAIMGKPDAAIAVLRRLAGQGIDLAIDDFGIGQSSFAYLRRLPVRELKVDRTFVARLGHSREDQEIVRSIVDLGHRLGYRVTAEGVEDAATLAWLADAGCDYAQGYFVARPMTVAAFDAFLAAGGRPGGGAPQPPGGAGGAPARGGGPRCARAPP
ncbi:MAG: putative bifunctional diguanylate cyclase/phosphodiesterase, partial [Luteimonas sp.]